MIALEGGPRQERLDAAAPAAIALRAGTLVVARPGQRVVAPLAGDAVTAVEHRAVDHDAAADARAQDDAEHHAGACSGAVLRLGDGEAVGVVAHANPAANARLDVSLERL